MQQRLQPISHAGAAKRRSLLQLQNKIISLEPPPSPPPLLNCITLRQFGQKNNGKNKLLLCHCARVSFSCGVGVFQGTRCFLCSHSSGQVLVLSRDSVPAQNYVTRTLSINCCYILFLQHRKCLWLEINIFFPDGQITSALVKAASVAVTG